MKQQQLEQPTSNLVLDFETPHGYIGSLKMTLAKEEYKDIVTRNWYVEQGCIIIHVNPLRNRGECDPCVCSNIIVHETIHVVINRILYEDIGYSQTDWAHFVMETGMDGFNPYVFDDTHEKSLEFYNQYIVEK